MNHASALERILAGLAAIPPAEWAAVVLALGYLLLAVRQNAWCWACAIASSAIFLVLFVQAGLVMQVALAGVLHRHGRVRLVRVAPRW